MKLDRTTFVILGTALLISSCDEVREPQWNNPLDPNGTSFLPGSELSPGDRIKFDVSNTAADWTGESAFLSSNPSAARMSFSPHYLRLDGGNFLVDRVVGRFATTTTYPSLYFPLSAAHKLAMAGTFIDPRDGEVYETMRIGTQTWMAQNLRRITATSDCYQASSDSCAKYGRLYTWADAMNLGTTYLDRTWGGTGVQTTGICPTGWHVPSDAEWQTLWNYVPTGEGSSLKTYIGWGSGDDGTDTVFFHGLPSGLRYPSGVYDSSGLAALYWSTAESSDSTATAWGLRQENTTFVSRSNYFKDDGYSVRCLHN